MDKPGDGTQGTMAVGVPIRGVLCLGLRTLVVLSASPSTH